MLSRSFLRFPVPVLGIAFSILLTGCSETASEDFSDAARRYDLAADLGVADIRLEKSRLRVADPKTLELLDEGWSYPEQDEQGTYVWALGETAELELFVADARSLDLFVHGRPFHVEGAPALEVSLSVARGAELEPITTRVLDPGAGEHRFRVPAGALRPGVNALVFSFSQQYRPSEWITGAEDSRPLTLQVYSFEIVGGVDAESPRRLEVPSSTSGAGGEGAGSAATPRERMELPVGSGAVWYLPIRSGDRLLVKAVEGDGDMEALVRVAGGPASSPHSSAASGAPPIETLPSRTLAIGEQADWVIGTDGEPRIARIEMLARQRVPWWRRWLAAEPADSRLVLEASILAGAGAASFATDRPSANPSEIPSEASPATASSDPVSAPDLPVYPDILVYMVDTLRADHLGAYGYERPTSPNLDRFAEDGIVFTQARAQTSWTRTAVASVFSGLYPQTHGVNDREDALPGGITTLAEYLVEAGYATAGVVTNGNAGPKFALGQGFEVYQHLMEKRQRPEVHILADEVHRWVSTWLGGQLARPSRAPFLLYAHATDPHAPYVPREPFRSRLAGDADGRLGELAIIRAIASGTREAGEEEAEDLRQLYDAEIAFWDHQFGRTIEYLKRAGLYDRMAILVLSDHGEEFLDHGGWEHGRTLYDEQLRVPMVLKLPGNEGAGSRLSVAASHVDVLPTLLDLVGLPLLDQVDGRSLLPSIRSTSLGAGSRSWAEIESSDRGGAPMMAFLGLEGRRQWSLVDGDSKLIAGAREEDRLYDLRTDPKETEPANALYPLRAGLLRQAIRRLELDLAMRSRKADHADIDPELREQLKALGYIQ